jgi:hypothetical protein
MYKLTLFNIVVHWKKWKRNIGGDKGTKGLERGIREGKG